MLSGIGGLVKTSGGDLTIDGTVTGAAATGIGGIQVQQKAPFQAGGAGHVRSTCASRRENPGIAFDTSGSGITAGTGDVSLEGNVIDLGTANSIGGAGGLTFNADTRKLVLGGSHQDGGIVFTDADRAPPSGTASRR